MNYNKNIKFSNVTNKTDFEEICVLFFIHQSEKHTEKYIYIYM